MRNYDMSGFNFDIYDVVDILRLHIHHVNAQSIDVNCPFCGSKGKLNINKEKNVYHCNKCDVQGGMLQLYAELHNVTFSEANRQIREALNRDVYRSDYEKKEWKEKKPVQNALLATPEEIDYTYSVMLSMLTLNQKHREDLSNRGLTEPQIEEQKYRSAPIFGLKALVRKMIEKGCTVKGVPGFYQDKDGTWSVNFKAKNSGFLIPIRQNGRILGMQIRLDHPIDKMKYIWFSSVNYELGVSSGSPVHVIGDVNAKNIYITEGALKGTIAHYLSGHTFVCVAGVNQYRNLKPVLEMLKESGMKYAYEAYDMDKKVQTACDRHDRKCAECRLTEKPRICPYKADRKKIIQRGCQMAYEICRSISVPVERMVWDMNEKGEWNGDLKGIDDFYYSEKQVNR